MGRGTNQLKRWAWIAAALAAWRWLACFGSAGGAGPASHPTGSAQAYQSPGPLAVESANYDWHDKARGRDVPAKIYYPAAGEGNWPVIIFSHGLGGSREGYAYLGRHWASHGFVCVHLTHVGSDSSVLKTASQPAGAMDALRAAAAAWAKNSPAEALAWAKSLQNPHDAVHALVGVAAGVNR